MTVCVQMRLSLSKTGLARCAKWGGFGVRATFVGEEMGRRKVLAGQELCGALRGAQGRMSQNGERAKTKGRNGAMWRAEDYQGL